MSSYQPQLINHSGGMYPPPFPMMPLQQTKPAVPCTAASAGFPVDFTWPNTTAATQPANNSMMISMHQSECNGLPPPPYPCPWLQPQIQNQSAMVPTYEEGSMLSPGSSDSSIAGVDELPYGHSHSSMTASPFSSNYYTSTGCEPVMNSFNQTSASSPETNECVQKEIKMPQRKGGIQLWQFLHSLLINPENKYNDLIEWTANMEFRILEPETIAIWWGHHKNKPNLTYEKFSRSLRYYYDKGILKKITGERYAYRFLIDPEVMYRHIGTSDCRPKIKPMPTAAKAAMTKFQKIHGIETKANDILITTQKAEPLYINGGILSSAPDRRLCVEPIMECLLPQQLYLNEATNQNYSLSTGKLARYGDAKEICTPGPIKRSRSLEDNRTMPQQHLPIANTQQLSSSWPMADTECRDIAHSIVTHDQVNNMVHSSFHQLPAYDTIYAH